MVFQHYTASHDCYVDVWADDEKSTVEEQRNVAGTVPTQLEEFRNRRPQQMSGGQQQRSHRPCPCK